MNSRIKLSIGVILLLLTSCLPVGIGDPLTSKIDARLTGYWLKAGAAAADPVEPAKATVLMIAPIDSHVYCVQQISSAMEDGKPKRSQLTFKAWLTEIAGEQFMVLQPMQGLASPTNREYQFFPTFKVTIVKDRFTAAMVDVNYEKLKDVTDAKEITDIIAGNIKDPALFNKDNSPAYSRVDETTPQGEALIKLFQE